MQSQSNNVRSTAQSLEHAIAGYAQQINAWVSSPHGLEQAAAEELANFLDDLTALAQYVCADSTLRRN